MCMGLERGTILLQPSVETHQLSFLQKVRRGLCMTPPPALGGYVGCSIMMATGVLRVYSQELIVFGGTPAGLQRCVGTSIPDHNRTAQRILQPGW